MAGRSKALQLWQEIVLTLALKAFLLAIIWTAWFSAPEDTGLDDQAVASKILSQKPKQEHDHDSVARTR